MNTFVAASAGIACLGFGALCVGGMVCLCCLSVKMLGIGLRDRQREAQMVAERERQERAKQERMIAGRILGGENGKY